MGKRRAKGKGAAAASSKKLELYRRMQVESHHTGANPSEQTKFDMCAVLQTLRSLRRSRNYEAPEGYAEAEDGVYIATSEKEY